MLLALLLLAAPAGAAPGPPVSLDDAISPSALRALEEHVLSPAVREGLERRIFVSRVSHNGQTHTYPSYRYTLDGFWRNWRRLATDGLAVGSRGRDDRLFLFAGDAVDRVTAAGLGSGRRAPRADVRVRGHEYVTRRGRGASASGASTRLVALGSGCVTRADAFYMFSYF